jgi:UDP-N-acetylglucosamine--N-acetylmuramyl-(pentapeptide) pyrophosphoryl-undecaprenol N-acetylglucosamine transferase
MGDQFKTILIMAGGTGGHVFPGIAVADELRRRGHHVVWLGTRYGIDATLVPQATIPYYQISIRGLRGKGKLGLLLAPFKILKAIYQSLKIIRHIAPDVVIGFGGYVTGPGAIAAKLLGVPLIIHEQNAIAGKTNRLLAPWAKHVLVAFPNSFPAKVTCQWVGNPLRENITQMSAPTEHKISKPINILVFGGSQGAKIINETVLAALLLLPENERPMVWHQVGRQQFDDFCHRYQQHQLPVKVEAFIDDMAQAYQWADLVICRSGALTISELAAAGKPSILIPLASAVDDHQTENARFLVNVNAAQLIPQNKLNAQKLVEIIKEFSNNQQQLITMAENAYRVAKLNATIAVADYCTVA